MAGVVCSGVRVNGERCIGSRWFGVAFGMGCPALGGWTGRECCRGAGMEAALVGFYFWFPGMVWKLPGPGWTGRVESAYGMEDEVL